MPSTPSTRLEAGRHTLGAAIRERRSRRGMTLPDLSTAAGLSISYLSDIERGRTLPSLERLDWCAQALGTTVAELLADLYPWGGGRPPELVAPPPDGRRRYGPKG